MRMRIKSIHFFTLGWLSCIFISSGGYAEMRTGALKVSPSLSLENRYDDNVLLTSSNTISSYIGVISPGLKATLPMGESSAVLDYRSDILRYSKNSSQYNSIHHSLLSQLNLRSRQGPAMTLSDQYQVSSDPPISELTGRVNYRQNTAQALGSTPLGHHMGLGAGYSFYSTSYEDATLRPLLDRSERLAIVNLNYHVRPKVQTFLEYDRGGLTYDTSSNGKDSKYDQFQGGVQGQITPKIKLIFKMGGQYRQYLATGNKAKTTVATLNAAYRPDASTEVEFIGERSVVESVFENNLFYRSTRFGSNLSRQVALKWRAHLDGDITLAGYPQPRTESGITDQRSDRLWRVNVGIDYALQKWLHADLHYQRRQRASNFSQFEYRDNLVALTIKASL
ncbi:MAG: hypothetical protein A2992_07050 [Elusimicrobia bacterium RIFCSPLOWO2_01_FULL_59_12]|nr:MAG: hypothetical protein A2992_07050 [Elusimicrobia bacterium RIFCSPLOWO2_01_FULL_59_12]